LDTEKRKIVEYILSNVGRYYDPVERGHLENRPPRPWYTRNITKYKYDYAKECFLSNTQLFDAYDGQFKGHIERVMCLKDINIDEVRFKTGNSVQRVLGFYVKLNSEQVKIEYFDAYGSAVSPRDLDLDFDEDGTPNATSAFPFSYGDNDSDFNEKKNFDLASQFLRLMSFIDSAVPCRRGGCEERP